MCMLTLFARISWLLKWFNAFWLYSFASVILFWCFWIFRFFFVFFLSVSFLLPLIFHSHSICKGIRNYDGGYVCVVHAKNNPFKPQKLFILGILPHLCSKYTRSFARAVRFDKRKYENWFPCYLNCERWMNRARTLTFCFHRVNYDISDIIVCTAEHSRTI